MVRQMQTTMHGNQPRKQKPWKKPQYKKPRKKPSEANPAGLGSGY